MWGKRLVGWFSRHPFKIVCLIFITASTVTPSSSFEVCDHHTAYIGRGNIVNSHITGVVSSHDCQQVCVSYKSGDNTGCEWWSFSFNSQSCTLFERVSAAVYSVNSVSGTKSCDLARQTTQDLHAWQLEAFIALWVLLMLCWGCATAAARIAVDTTSEISGFFSRRLDSNPMGQQLKINAAHGAAAHGTLHHLQEHIIQQTTSEQLEDSQGSTCSNMEQKTTPQALKEPSTHRKSSLSSVAIVIGAIFAVLSCASAAMASPPTNAYRTCMKGYTGYNAEIWDGYSTKVEARSAEDCQSLCVSGRFQRDCQFFTFIQNSPQSTCILQEYASTLVPNNLATFGHKSCSPPVQADSYPNFSSDTVFICIMVGAVVSLVTLTVVRRRSSNEGSTRAESTTRRGRSRERSSTRCAGRKQSGNPTPEGAKRGRGKSVVGARKRSRVAGKKLPIGAAVPQRNLPNCGDVITVGKTEFFKRMAKKDNDIVTVGNTEFLRHMAQKGTNTDDGTLIGVAPYADKMIGTDRRYSSHKIFAKQGVFGTPEAYGLFN